MAKQQFYKTCEIDGEYYKVSKATLSPTGVWWFNLTQKRNPLIRVIFEDQFPQAKFCI